MSDSSKSLSQVAVDETAILLGANTWFYMPSRPLGPAGGFGEVFLGRSSQNMPVAVKRLKISAADGAHRELGMAEFHALNGRLKAFVH